MKEDNRLWILIGRKLSGEATEDELKELAGLSQKDPDIPYYITILSIWWLRTEHLGKKEADKELGKLLRVMEKKGPRSLPRNPDSGRPGIKNHLKTIFRRLWKSRVLSFFYYWENRVRLYQ